MSGKIIGPSGGTGTGISKAESEAAIKVEKERAEAVEALKIPLAQKGAASGVPELDAGKHIPSAQIPAVAFSEVFVVASEAAQLALAAKVGDLAIRTDSNKTYVLSKLPVGTFANWIVLKPETAVETVNAKTGTVNLTFTDVNADKEGLAAAEETRAKAAEKILEEHNPPTGGTTGQALTKKSATNWDMQWTTTGGGGGLTAAEVEALTGSGKATGPVFFVGAFGASGNGTDQTTAIEAAITACKAAGGGRILFDAGTYRLKNITIDSSTSGGAHIVIEGAAALATILKPVAGTESKIFNIIGHTNGTESGFALERLRIEGESGTNYAYAKGMIELTDMNQFKIRDVFGTHNAQGTIFKSNGAYNFSVDKLFGGAGEIGVFWDYDTSAKNDQLDTVKFDNCEFTGKYPIIIRQATNGFHHLSFVGTKVVQSGPEPKIAKFKAGFLPEAGATVLQMETEAMANFWKAGDPILIGGATPRAEVNKVKEVKAAAANHEVVLEFPTRYEHKLASSNEKQAIFGSVGFQISGHCQNHEFTQTHMEGHSIGWLIEACESMRFEGTVRGTGNNPIEILCTGEPNDWVFGTYYVTAGQTVAVFFEQWAGSEKEAHRLRFLGPFVTGGTLTAVLKGNAKLSSHFIIVAKAEGWEAEYFEKEVNVVKRKGL